MNKKILVIGIILLFVLMSLSHITSGSIECNLYREFLKGNINSEKQINHSVFGSYSADEIPDFFKYQFDDFPFYRGSEMFEIIDHFEQSSQISDGPMNSAWPMKCHDVHHTSQSPYSTVDNPGIEKWRFYSSGWVETGIAIDNDGVLYCKIAYNELDRYIFAIYPNGTEKWKFKTNNLIWSTPAIGDDGTIYIGSYDTRLYAINPDGSKKWHFGSGGSIASSPVIAEDGTIYFGVMGPENNGRIWALNPNGTEKWYYDTGYWIVSDPAIGDDGTIYIGSGDSYLYAMWPNGTLRWRFKTGDLIKAHPSTANDGTIYISSFNGYLYAINPNGTLKWKYSGGEDEASPAIDKNGIIYVGNTKLRAIYPDGSEKWSINVPGGNIDHSSPAISDDGTIYVGAGCNIVAINSDGTINWHKRIANKWVDSSPSIAEDGTVYIGSTYDMGKGYLHAFGPQESNDPPEPPSITGPPNGKIDASYTFSFLSTDPDRNPISYYANWGDGTNSGWTEDVNTGELVTLSHTWKHVNTFTIRAKVRDTFGLESDETEFEIKISNPRTKTWMQFLDLFPILQRILGFIK